MSIKNAVLIYKMCIKEAINQRLSNVFVKRPYCFAKDAVLGQLMQVMPPKCVYASMLYLKKINKKNENKIYLPVCRQAGLLTVNVLDIVGKCVCALTL